MSTVASFESVVRSQSGSDMTRKHTRLSRLPPLRPSVLFESAHGADDASLDSLSFCVSSRRMTDVVFIEEEEEEEKEL